MQSNDVCHYVLSAGNLIKAQTEAHGLLGRLFLVPFLFSPEPISCSQ